MQDIEQIAARGTSAHKKDRSILLETVKFTIVALLIVAPFRFFIAQPFIVSGASMVPTFGANEYLVIDQISYRFEKPQRGDVVVFRYPLETSSFFIKRIVGLPGEVVEIENDLVYVYEEDAEEHAALVEPYLKPGAKGRESVAITLSDDEYYVLGDNRKASSDSRVWGPLKEKFIVGRAIVRLLPIQDVELFPGKYEFKGAE